MNRGLQCEGEGAICVMMTALLGVELEKSAVCSLFFPPFEKVRGNLNAATLRSLPYLAS